MPSLRYALHYSWHEWLLVLLKQSRRCVLSAGAFQFVGRSIIGRVIIIRFLLFSRIRVQFGSCSADQQFSSAAAAAAVELFLCWERGSIKEL